MKQFLGCLLALFMLTIPALAVDTAAQAVPAKIGVLISTKAFGETVKDVEAVAGAVLKGTPFQMFLMPGMLEMQFLANELQLPPEFIDNTRPVHSVALLDDAGQGGAQCYILSVKGLAAKVDNFKSTGSTVASPAAGVYQITGQDEGGFFLVEAGKEQVVYSQTLEGARALADILKSWTPQAATNTVCVYINIAGLYAANKATIDALPETIAADMAQGNKDKEMSNVLKAVGLFYGEGITEAVKGSESLVVTADASAEGVKVQVEQKTVAGTPLAKIAADCAAFKADELNQKLMKVLPADPFSVLTVSYPKPVTALFAKGMESLAPTLVEGAKSVEEKAQMFSFLQNIANWLKLCGKTSVSSYGVLPDGSMNCAVVGDIQSGKEAQWQATAAKSVKESIVWNEKMYGATTPTKLTVEEKKLGGVDVLVVTGVTQLPPDGAAIPGFQGGIDLLNKNNRYVLGSKKTYWLMTFGGNAEAEFETIVKRLDGDAPVVSPDFAKGYAASADHNLFSKGVNLNAFLRQLAIVVKPIIAAAKVEDAEKVNGMIEQFVTGLPKESPLILSAAGAREDGFRGSFSLPVAAIKGAVDQGIAAYINVQMQMQIQQKNAAKGAAPAAKPGDVDGDEGGKEDSE